MRPGGPVVPAVVACALVVVMLLGCGSSMVLAQTPSLVASDQLRVCADPGNLPFSNDKEEGFENQITQLIAKDMGVPITYVWFPQAVGFTRNTLKKDRCDLVSGTVSGDEDTEDTNPYYHSGFMMVTRLDDGVQTHKIGDPGLADKRFGVVAATPPTNILVQDDLMANVKTYPLVVDTRIETPALEMLRDIIDRKIDVGLLWGPFAGYYIKQQDLPLRAVFVAPEGQVRLDFRMTMGVRPGEAEWRRRINGVLVRHQDDIRRILDGFGIPLLDDTNQPLNPTAKVE